MPDEPGRLTRLRPWASTKELTNPPGVDPDAGPDPGTGAGPARPWPPVRIRGLAGYGCIALVVALVLAAAAFGASPNRALARAPPGTCPPCSPRTT